MAVLLERTQGTKREDLADLLSRIDAKGTPATSMIPKGKEPTNTLFEWVVDDHEAAASAGNVDGTDFVAGDYGNLSPNRAKIAGRVQIFQKPFGVSTLAEEVSDVAGLGRKAEMRESIKKALTSLKRGIESRICGETDSQADNGTLPYLTRGLFSWVGYTGGANADPTDNAIPTLAKTPDSHIWAGTTAHATPATAFNEDDMQDLLEGVFNSTGGNSNFQLLCGTKLKRRFTTFATYSPSITGTTALRTYNQDSGGKKIIQTVDVFVGDFGQVDLIPTHWLRQDSTGGSITTRQQGSGLLLDTSLLKLRYNSLPTFKEVEDRGGGRKGFVRAILGLQVTNPKGLGAIVDTTT
jgi:hypothetical protein